MTKFKVFFWAYIAFDLFIGGANGGFLPLHTMVAAQTTVSGTVVDANGNPYANGTASATSVANSGQATVYTTPVATSSTGAFSMSVPSPNTYIFTICAPPTSVGPLGNLTPAQVCFSSPPTAIAAGGAVDISATLNAAAAIIGPAQAKPTLTIPNPLNAGTINATGPVTAVGPMTITNGRSGAGFTPDFTCLLPANSSLDWFCDLNGDPVWNSNGTVNQRLFTTRYFLPGTPLVGQAPLYTASGDFALTGPIFNYPGVTLTAATDTTHTNAYVGCPAGLASPQTLVLNTIILVGVTTGNNGATTLNWCGSGVKNVMKIGPSGPVNLVSGDWPANSTSQPFYAPLKWDGVEWDDIEPASVSAGTVTGQQKGFASIGNTTATTLSSSAAFVDASLYAGAPDVCLQIKNAETALVSSGSSAFQIVIPITNKAYCGTVPQATNAHGDIYFVGNGARARVYLGISMIGLSSGIHIHGTGPAGVTNTAASNVQFVACNPLLHDNTYPTNSDGAPCSAYFNSTTNMPQATVSSITLAGGSPSTSTITLTGALSGTPPTTFAGRLLCIGMETPTLANANCYEIRQEPTGGGTVFVVNSTNLVACNATCGGKVYLDTPMFQFSVNTVGNTGFFVSLSDASVDCAYVYACGNIVNGADQEGTRVNNVQLFNATAYGLRMFVGNNVANGTGAAYNGNSGGGSHSGPYGPLWINYQSEDCEVHSGTGCFGTNTNVNTGANQAYPPGTLMACGDNTALPLNTNAILSYSSGVPHSPCQRNFAGIVSDGIAMGTNTQSFYGLNGITVSCKDVFNTGSHVEMPELVNGIGMFFAGPTQSVDGFHVEYCTTAVEVNGDATLNETWIEDGSTPMQGLTLINADINNCSTPATGHPTTMWCIDLGSAQGTSNIMNVSLENVSEGNGTRAVQNQLVSGGNCTNSSDKTVWYHFEQMASPSGGYVLQSDCSTVVNQFSQGVIAASVKVGTQASNFPVVQEIATGTQALGTAAIAAGACATVITVAVTGIVATDNIVADFSADPSGTTGYNPATGVLTIYKYWTSGNINFKVCNPTGSSITPGAVTLNWAVHR